ncbi:MAG: DUF2313 domain-containing protein [Patescibacteria group bacterium]|nr:DUF2313 domain-containing protein [Patescibacteria group bacterium]
MDSDLTIDSGLTLDADSIVGTFTAAQYAQAARNLLPPGRAWNHEDNGTSASVLYSIERVAAVGMTLPPAALPGVGSNQSAFCDALGIVYGQQDLDSLQMLANFFPATATQGIDEWNASLGLPDPCMGTPATEAAAQQQITARLIATGGQSVPYFLQLASALGFEITITEFTPTEPGADAPAGMILNANDWAHTWRVNVLNSAVAPPTAQLACLLERYKPAHTQFYIVIGASPTTSTRLFNATDNVSEPLLISITTR